VGQLGSQVDEEAEAQPAATEPVTLVDDGFVDFQLAGAEARGEFRCTDCGYGAVIQRVLPVCPMCSGRIWEARPPRG
jgi:rubrerythrin